MRGAVALALALAGCNAVFGLEVPETTTPLTGLVPSRGALVPAFDPSITRYTLAVSVLAQQVTFTPEAPVGIAVLIGGDTVVPNTASAPVRLPMGASRIEVHVDEPEDGRTTYTIDVDRGGVAPVARRLASTTPVVDGSFGSAFAVDGDRVAIAAVGESPYGLDDCDGAGVAPPFVNTGAVHVYRATADGYVLEQRIEPPAGTACARFGQSIALDGDRLVVGNWFELVDGNPQAGAVHVYQRTGGGWTHVKQLIGPGFPPFGRFGLSVAAADGWILVGAPGIELDRGRVYAFHEGDDFTNVQTLGRHVDQAGSQIGYAIAVDHTRLVASAPGDATGAVAAGSLGLHALSAGVWTPVTAVRAAAPSMEDQLGLSLGLEGGRLVAGAPLAAARRGELHVFAEDGGGVWGQTADLRAATAADDDLLGNQVALRGDLAVTGWCRADVALAGWATVEPTPPGPAAAGVALIYQVDSMPPRLVGALGRDVPEANAHFGCMNALAADRLFLGGHGEAQDGIAQAGAAYVVE